VSSSASHGGLDAVISAVTASKPWARNCDAVKVALAAAGACVGEPVQAGSAARTASTRPGFTDAHSSATAAPIDTPPTRIRPCASAARSIASR